jgi:hypothetical protein
MKQFIIVIFLSIFSSAAYSQKTPEGVTYKYGVHEIDKRKYIKNIRANVYNYLNYKDNWSEYKKEEFRLAYQWIINLFDDPNKPYRFYTNDLGTLVDTEGEVCNVDKTDNYWYDKKGRRINGDTYAKLKDKDKKKYYQINANRMVVDYFDEIAGYLLQAMKNQNK